MTRLYGVAPEVHFERKVLRPDDPNECWLWQAKRNQRGYGVFAYRQGDKSVRALAHRFGYQLWVGPVPDGLYLDHLCQITSCVNPAHLEPVTPAENVLRWSARRQTCVNNHPLTEENTYIPSGSNRRRCRTCMRAADQRYLQNKRETQVISGG